MLELGRKEPQLLSGIVVQIVLVALLVFAYTQAIRQLKLQQELQARLQEQLALAREQVAKQAAKADLATLQAQMAELKSFMVVPDRLAAQADRLKVLAEQQFGVQNAQVKVGLAPMETMSIPLEGRPDFIIQLYTVELTGFTTTRNTVALLHRIGARASKVLCSLVGMELRASEISSPDPVDLSLKWVVAVESVSGEHPTAPSESPMEKIELPPLAWGWREEPFRSPLTFPRALRIPPERLAGLHLTGIVWDPAQPTCVINEQVLKPGDWVKGYQVVWMSHDTVLLQGAEEELLLRLS